jgi:hypothetical protein
MMLYLKVLLLHVSHPEQSYPGFEGIYEAQG